MDDRHNLDGIAPPSKSNLDAAWDAVRAAIPPTLPISARLEIWKAALNYGDARVGDFISHIARTR